jgi:hypothetical protein
MGHLNIESELILYKTQMIIWLNGVARIHANISKYFLEGFPIISLSWCCRKMQVGVLVVKMV